MFIPEGFAQVNIRYTGSGAPTGAEVTFAVALEPVLAGAAVVAEAIGDIWRDTVNVYVSNTITFDSILVKFGPNDTGESAVVAYGVAGSVSDDPAGPQVASLVRKNTNHGGRQGRGRLFLPGVPEESTDEAGNLDAGYHANLQEQFDNLHEGLVTAEYLPVLLHGAALPVPYDITSFSVQVKTATQRHRLRR